MTDEVVIITPELSAGIGGLADYTRQLANELHDRCRCRFVLPDGAPGSPDEEVTFVSRDEGALRKQLPTRGGKVLVQYSAYGFDHRGHPRWLLRELTDWKKRGGGLLVMMFHEIWTFRPVLNKDYLVQQLHRHAIARVLRVADAVFTSTDDQANHLRKLEPQCAAQVLPVGSNIPALHSPNESREPRTATIFGLENSRVRDLRALQDSLHSLAAATVLDKIVTCGGNNSPNEHSLLAALPLRNGFVQRGQLTPNEIGNALGSARFALWAQHPLSLQKSGSFMAYAANGLNIISPHADSLGAEPICWLVNPRELLAGIDDAELKSRAENLHSWQERTASWCEIAARVAEALQLPPR